MNLQALLPCIRLIAPFEVALEFTDGQVNLGVVLKMAF